MRNPVDQTSGWGARGWCLILFYSLCASTWAADSPPRQIALDSQSAPATLADYPLTGDLPTDHRPKIAIIIDDLGYSRELSQRAARLSGAVTLSVLPHSPHGRLIAKLAGEHGKELMLHAPMSSVGDKPLDFGGLTADMTKAQFLATVSAALEDLPNVRGVNNHMGSELTQYRQPMNWLMRELRGRRLYFVDSRTIASSLAWETALHFGVPTTRRDIFLDNEASYPAVAQQFGKLLALAKRHGQAVAIAHPYPETLHFLETALPMLPVAGIQLVPVSQLLSSPGLGPKDSPSAKRIVDRPREVVGPLYYLSK